MNPAAEPRPWTARRWWTAILVLFIAQAVFVFLLLDRSPVVPRKPAGAPLLRLAGNQKKELLALEDPTLFALPHQRGFSSTAWLNLPAPHSPQADWSEPPRFLPAPATEWGAALARFIETNQPPPLPTIAGLDARLPERHNFSIAPPPVPSRLRVEGDLARRTLLTPLSLHAWTNTDLLTNSIVQLLVDARGDPVSAVLLRAGSPGPKQKEADLHALELAQTTRFNPVGQQGSNTNHAPADLTIGTLVFQWQTILSPTGDATSPAP